MRSWTNTAAAADGCCVERWCIRAQVCAPKQTLPTPTLNTHGGRGGGGENWLQADGHVREQRVSVWRGVCRRGFVTLLELGWGGVCDPCVVVCSMVISPAQLIIETQRIVLFFMLLGWFNWPARLLHTIIWASESLWRAQLSKNQPHSLENQRKSSATKL